MALDVALMNGETPHEVTNGHDLKSPGANSERYEHESGRSGGAKTSALVFPQPRDRSDHRWSDTKLRARRLSRLDGDPLAQASDRRHIDSGQGGRHRQSDRLGPRRGGTRRQPVAPLPRRRRSDLRSFHHGKEVKLSRILSDRGPGLEKLAHRLNGCQVPIRNLPDERRTGTDGPAGLVLACELKQMEQRMAH